MALLSLRSLGCLSLGLLAVACSDAEKGGGGAATNDATGGVVFSSEVQPLSSFSFDTGLVPAGSPAQVQLTMLAGGGIKVDAVGMPSANGLDGKPGSGKVGVDLHLKLAGRLKVDSTFKSIDEDLPGLGDLDIKIAGEQAFDPFLVNDGENARVEAKMTGELPEIPLGATPGKLRLTIAEGSVVRSWFRGSCVSVTGGQATYAGEVTTEGNLVLHGVLALDLPAPFNKEVDLGDITVPISGGTMPLDFGAKPAAGATEKQLGAKCAGKSAETPAKTTKPAETPEPKTSRDDGKHTIDPNTGKACVAFTCEDYSGACGPHDDGCGSTITCGVCQTACVPLKCEDLGASCGTHSDGCSGVLNCGVCPTACANDSYEPNNQPSQAQKLGNLADTDESSFYTANLLMSDGDEDWFTLDVTDEGFGGNPTIHAKTTDKKLEVTAFHVCTSQPDYSYCDGEGSQDNTVGHGCRGSGEVALSTDCSGIDESGKTYVRVRKLLSDGMCHPYEIVVSVN